MIKRYQQRGNISDLRSKSFKDPLLKENSAIFSIALISSNIKNYASD